jgi:hypothetical protein
LSADQAQLIEDVLGGVVEIGPNRIASQLAAAHARDIAARQPQPVPPVTAGVARPGDVLLVGCGHNLTREQADRLRTDLLARLPGIGDVVLLPMMTVEGIYRGGEL